MFGLIKFLMAFYRSAVTVLHPDRNDLRHAPASIKYIASILLACFWCLAFGLYFGELIYIGYNMIGHIAIVSMVFVTVAVFRYFRRTYAPPMVLLRPEFELLRDPARAPKCYEMTDHEREQAAVRLGLGYDTAARS
jgi:small-conductance mechanosensitive channel